MIQYNNFIDAPYNDWQEISIIVSRDCTLRCKYCYLKKSKDNDVDIDAMIASVDKVMAKAYKDGKEGVILTFYPEPWVNIERTEELIKKSLNCLTHYDRYMSNYMVNIGTNGVNLHKPIPILESIKDHLSIAVTIDGIQEQHDKYRVFPDGSPSWDIVRRNILTYQEKYRIYGTKVTIGPDTIKYIYDSSLFLWDEMHLQDINMNVVFEDLWGDDIDKCLAEFEEQLKLLSDDIIKNRRWEHMQYQSLLGKRMFPNSWLGTPDQSNARTYCGAAAMRSIDSDGKIYPCFRLSPYALSEDKTYNVDNQETWRSLKLLNNFDSAVEKCRHCELLQDCSMCVGGAFEEAHSIYWRTTHHCEFDRLQAKYAFELHKKINNEVAE